MKRFLIILVILGAVAAAVYFLVIQPRAAEQEAADATTTAVDVNTLAVSTGLDVVSAEGQIVPLRHANLAFEGGGEIVEILVTEGQSVQAGDPLAHLDATDLEIAVQQAEAGLTQAQANLTAAQASLQAAQVGVTVAELGVETAQANLELVQSPPLTQEVALSELGIAAAEAGINLAASNRNVALNVATDAQIRSAEAQVAQANAALNAIQTQYDDLIENEILGPIEEDTRYQLEIAQANRSAAQARLDELNAGATPAQVWAAGAGVTLAQVEQGRAQAQLALLLAGATPEQINQAEVAVQQAETAVTRAELTIAQAEAGVAQAETAVLQAQASLDAAQDALDRMTLTAPFAGTIASLTLELGEVATPGVPVGIIADFSGWHVETTDLTELDIVAVKVGLPVEVQVDALPNEVLEGVVEDIAAVASLTRGDVTYAVTIRLEDVSDLPLRWGMTTFVDVDVE
ncbi:MAG: efflux RND transporter periplasmic adaptor subunit [Ardenticatenaceae bacterium]|nr:efflux RND transporter periplasmic adaptor subunit [Ardenticatenaceae bacterium]